MPTAHRLTGFGRIFEAHARECFERFGVVLRARKNKRALLGCEISPLFKQPRIMTLNRSCLFSESRRK